MSSYTVKSTPTQLKTYDSDYGSFAIWSLELEGVGAVELHKKLGNAPPTEGTMVVGEVVEKEYKGETTKRLKLAAPGNSTTSAKTYERQADHPIQMQRALHTSAMSIAPVLIEQLLTIGVIDQPKDKAAYLELVSGVASWVKSSYPAAVLQQAAK